MEVDGWPGVEYGQWGTWSEEHWEGLGRLVREVWVEWAAERRLAGDPHWKPSWDIPWEALDAGQWEVDRRIGRALWEQAYSDGVTAGLEVAINLYTTNGILEEEWQWNDLRLKAGAPAERWPDPEDDVDE